MRELLFFILGCLFVYYLLDIRNNCYLYNNNYSLLSENIKILVRQAARWSTAAKQDESSMIAVLHANYGAGYLWAVKDIATDDQIAKAAGIDIRKFEKEIVEIQDQATIRMSQLCPDYGPESSYLTSIGGEG
tara:strand:+ start:2883 stop:3278 length:396 start_codon:yes stop_codon:yes gene_type:complete